MTRIGSDNLFMAYSHVGARLPRRQQRVFANYATLGGHVKLGDWVNMGGYSGIHQFCKVGAHAFIGNNTAVTRDVPPYVMAVGQPAEPHTINSEGLKRRGFTPEQIRHIRDAYRILYRSQLKLQEADRAAGAARRRAAGAGALSSRSSTIPRHGASAWGSCVERPGARSTHDPHALAPWA